jgi:O-antigen ligase
VVAEIIENPILGIGIAGDTRIIGNSYVHNFFIEVIGNYGIILGVIVSIIVLLLIMKFLLAKDTFKYNLVIIWLSLGFVHLMVSGSYLTDLKFWIFLGLMINSQSKRVRGGNYVKKNENFVSS